MVGQWRICSVGSLCLAYGVLFTGKRTGWPKQATAERVRIAVARTRMRLSAKGGNLMITIAVMIIEHRLCHACRRRLGETTSYDPAMTLIALVRSTKISRGGDPLPKP